MAALRNGTQGTDDVGAALLGGQLEILQRGLGHACHRGLDRPQARRKPNEAYAKQLTVRLWDLAKNPPVERLVATPKSMPKEVEEEEARPEAVWRRRVVLRRPLARWQTLGKCSGGAVRLWKVSDKGAEEWANIKTLKESDRFDTVTISPDGKSSQSVVMILLVRRTTRSSPSGI